MSNRPHDAASANGPPLNKDGGEPRDALELAAAEASRRPSALRGEGRKLAVGLAFLAPNIVGFLAFTLLPLIFAMVLAFTNWDLSLHNDQLRAQGLASPIKFVGLGNFADILFDPVTDPKRAMLGGLLGMRTWDADFWKYFGNTLFFMMALPLGIAFSLLSAIALSKRLDGGAEGGGKSPHRRALLGFGALGALLLLLGGAGVTLATWSDVAGNLNGMPMLLCAVAALILLGGAVGGQAVYRTLFYMPFFVSGVATFLLWKKIFNPQTGPLTAALRPPLAALGSLVNALPAWLVSGLSILPVAAAAWVAFWGMAKLRRDYRDGEIGRRATLLPAGLLLLPGLLALRWFGVFAPPFGWPALLAIALLAAAVAGGVVLAAGLSAGQIIRCKPAEGAAGATFTASGLAVLQFALVGLAAAVYALPANAAAGLAPPQWLGDVHWAKPSIMFMGLWGAIGGQTMLLYIAALTNVPQDLYEAADLDGAGPLARFWNVTWPQLAPTTFFVVVMGVIGGLQGGFEMARTMTAGGPAGQTTTLSYYIYSQGFEDTRLALASAISWVMFFFVLAVTVFNWKFGNRYVNE